MMMMMMMICQIDNLKQSNFPCQCFKLLFPLQIILRALLYNYCKKYEKKKDLKTYQNLFKDSFF